MTPEREIEILKMLKEQILRDGMILGLCFEMYELCDLEKISESECTTMQKEFKKWAKTTLHLYGLSRITNYAAPPGEIPPRIEYIDNRIKKIDCYIEKDIKTL